MTQMTPPEIVSELDKHIVGQGKAKKAVAVALRNRWRRAQVAEPLKSEITPKNILMIGPTGVGKTEIARRLARLANAPFIKIEATKFTEVGYVGRDVDTIIRDLVEIAIKSHREQAMKKVRDRAQDAAEDRVLDILLPPARPTVGFGTEPAAPEDNATRQKFRKKLREGDLDDDGALDLVLVLNAGSTSPLVLVMLGQKDGTFKPVGGGPVGLTRSSAPSGVAVATADSKAKPYVVISGTVSGRASIDVLKNDGAGVLSMLTQTMVAGNLTGASHLVLADVNGN